MEKRLEKFRQNTQESNFCLFYRRGTEFFVEDWKIKISHGLEKSFFINAFYFCKRVGNEILIEDWKVTINRGLGSVSV